MLYLISLGLHDEKDMSLKGLEVAKKCEKLYCELYTNRPHTTLERLSELVNKKVIEVSRSGLEENSEKILKEAKKKNVGILVGGDALTATTHISLIMDAKRMGIDTEIIHGSSIFTAIAETGLQLYNFGKATTLAFPEKGYSPTSAYDAIEINKKLGMHTLVLLDTKPDKQMDAKKGLEILLELENQKRKELLTKETKLVVACCLGGNSVIKYGLIKNLLKDENIHEKTPAVIIVPGKLHFLEEEFLESL